MPMTVVAFVWSPTSSSLLDIPFVSANTLLVLLLCPVVVLQATLVGWTWGSQTATRSKLPLLIEFLLSLSFVYTYKQTYKCTYKAVIHFNHFCLQDIHRCVIYLPIHKHIHIHINIYTYTYIHICTHLYVCICSYTYTSTHAYISTRIHTNM